MTSKCIICGADFEPKHKESKCCGRECATIKQVETHRQQLAQFVCQHCGKVYRVTGARLREAPARTKYCSVECSKAITIIRAKAKIKPVPPERTCLVCGKRFRSSYEFYCSNDCRMKRGRHKSRERSVAKNNVISRPCKECGKAFISEYGDKRRAFCSKECSDRFANKMADHSNYHARIRVRDTAAFVAPVSKTKVFKRDGWICQICHKKVNPKLPHTHPMGATLDHIIPLSQGGTHEPKNVQLAHRYCNCYQKRDRAVGCQLRMFG